MVRLETCLIFQASQRHPDQEAVCLGDGTSVTYQALNKLVEAKSELILASGFRSGDRLSICEAVNVDTIALLFACFRVGVVAQLLSTRDPNASGSRLGLKETMQTEDREFATALSGQQYATVIYTSGTTGIPKGIVHSYGNHFYSALGANDNMPLLPGDRWLLSLPVSHVSGLAILFRCFLAGATVVLSAESIADAIETQKITHLSLVPMQLRQLIADGKKFPSLKAILLGGDRIPESLVADAITQGLPIHVTYGLSEMASQVWTADVTLPYRELKISASGEILVKGKTLFQGYVDDDMTVLPLDSDGWFQTGDLGVLDANGLLQVMGRRDNMFISGGENIYPEEIEKELLKIAGIEMAIVVPVSDDHFGCRPVAWIKSSGQISEEELQRALSGSLAKFKIPDRFLSL